MKNKIRLGISACLLGKNVRYDGRHKKDLFLTDILGQYAEYVPVCPETECGMGVPRETLRLVGEPESPRLLTTQTKIDYTDRMIRWAKIRVAELETQKLCGFVFKSNSPSSGMERVNVFDDKGIPLRKGVGIFARIFMEHFPGLPVIEDIGLHDPEQRKFFIKRIHTMKHKEIPTWII